MKKTPDTMTDHEAMAAEFVLGTLPRAERLTAEALLGTDPNFSAAIATWQARLAPLNQAIEERSPPADVQGRVELRLFPDQAKATIGWVLGAILAAVVALAALAVFLWPEEPADHGTPAVTPSEAPASAPATEPSSDPATGQTGGG